jgi:hypothetical protein
MSLARRRWSGSSPRRLLDAIEIAVASHEPGEPVEERLEHALISDLAPLLRLADPEEASRPYRFSETALGFLVPQLPERGCGDSLPDLLFGHFLIHKSGDPADTGLRVRQLVNNSVLPICCGLKLKAEDVQSAATASPNGCL